MTKEFQSDFLSVGLDFKGARQNFLDTTTNMARFVRISCSFKFNAAVDALDEK